MDPAREGLDSRARLSERSFTHTHTVVRMHYVCNIAICIALLYRRTQVESIGSPDQRRVRGRENQERQRDKERTRATDTAGNAVDGDMGRAALRFA